MKRWAEYKAEVSAVNPVQPVPEVAYTWVAYKAGTCTPCPTRAEAEKVSKNVERVAAPESLAARAAYLREERAQEAQALANWKADLRAEYDELPDEVYNICYQAAYEEGHSAGYDEVANNMDDVVDMAKKIKAAYRTAGEL